MNLKNETVEDLIKSINELATELKNIDRRIGALCTSLGTLASTIKSSAGAKKD